MTNKQRKSFQNLPIANISLKQFDAETKNFAPEQIEKEPAIALAPIETAPPVAPVEVAVKAELSADKTTKRLTIDLDDDMNYKFTLFALKTGKKKTEVIREWIAEAIVGL
jgi:hypothetical protein